MNYSANNTIDTIVEVSYPNNDIVRIRREARIHAHTCTALEYLIIVSRRHHVHFRLFDYRVSSRINRNLFRVAETTDLVGFLPQNYSTINGHEILISAFYLKLS